MEDDFEESEGSEELEESKELEESESKVFKNSYGAGNRNKSSKKYKPNPKSAAPEREIVLTELDDDYPKDVPRGARYYQKFWTQELREPMDQGLQRTCWTIASNRCLSARLLIERRADPPLFLSALHLLVGLFKRTDVDGGLQNLEFLRTFFKDEGTILENDCKCEDPFAVAKAKGKLAHELPNPILCTDKGQQKRKFKVQDLVILENVDENELIRLVNQGPVVVIMEVDKAFETFRGDVIYKGPKKGCKIIDNHMMLLTGYGTCKKEHYWMCQNSAGLRWGDKGFVKIVRQISREKNQPSLFCGILYPVLLDRAAYNPMMR